VSYEWFDEDADSGEWIPLGQGEMLDVALALGSHPIWLRVTDHAGETSAAAISVVVVDTTPPEFSVTAAPAAITHPNHRMVAVELDVVTRDACGDVGVLLTGADSNAPPHPGKGRPGFLADIQDAELGTDDRAVRLRAEGNPKVPPRVYTLTYSATDESGNESLARVEVPVLEPRGVRSRPRQR
jgi:hypothetical protein